MKKKVTLTTQQKVVLMIIIMAVVSVATIFFWIIPAVEESNRLHVKYMKKRDEVLSLLKKGSTAGVLKAETQEYDQKLLDMQQGFINPGEEILFVQFMAISSTNAIFMQKINIYNL